MDTPVSSCCNVESVPQEYVFPPHLRPGNFTFSASDSTPVIDLGQLDGAAIVQQIFPEDKASVYSEDPTRSCRLCNNIRSYEGQNIALWREDLRLYCNPLQKHIQEWPQKPLTYREVVGKYTEEITKLGSRILEMICEGLGLESGYFEGEMSENKFLSVNNYPRCPEPSLTYGTTSHCDPGLLTILLQDDVGGLQFLKDGEWLGVGPLPNSFVVNIGYQLQIISNNILTSAEHRAVTNSKEDRISAPFFINPSNGSIIRPAKGLVNSCNPPLYTSFESKEFLINFQANNSNPQLVLERYKIQQ
ncbi:2-oxoglutarate (2OG) and Fe(II)-dependent oxygenase superfamily protein [Euphorbia peplus]|nr:2-oxoglutarate (2OG) and Fe(II)-dependent oxygenase superfamily protein [Euphorbia peplus]